jgi:hypothetical protein
MELGKLANEENLNRREALRTLRHLSALELLDLEKRGGEVIVGRARAAA